MVILFSGIFLILHGIVFYLYSGQSARLFELKPGMTWPDGSWVFSKFYDDKITRRIVLISCLLSGTGFVTSGIAILFETDLWQQMVVISVVFSSIIIILLWNGSFQKLTDQGFLGLIINIAIIAVLLF